MMQTMTPFDKDNACPEWMLISRSECKAPIKKKEEKKKTFYRKKRVMYKSGCVVIVKDSLAELAKYLGVTANTISKRIGDGNTVKGGKVSLIY